MNRLEVKILEQNDKKLREISSEVTDFNNEIYQEMLDEMKAICLKKKAYAAAAPQFGILKRFILIMSVEELKINSVEELDTKQINYTVTPYFNPKIIKMRGKQYFYETCMSVENAAGRVVRPYYVEIEAQDIHGNSFIKIAEGFEAIIFCHEIDHLDGIEYTDKAEKMFYNVVKEERIALRKKYPHEIISKDCLFRY